MIKIIKYISSDVVVFAGDDLSLDESGCGGDGWRCRNIDPGELTLEIVDDVPANFIGGGWTYINGVWESNQIGQDYITTISKSMVPAFVTRRQLRLALLAFGMLSTANEFVSEQSEEVKIYWNDSQEFYRQHPMIISMSAQFGLTESQVDNIFIAASTQ
jgi:hypothetical protein